MVSHERGALLTTHWNNRSLSSVVSDAATFHSAHAHHSPVELSRLESPLPNSTSSRSPHSTSNIMSTKAIPLPSLQPEAAPVSPSVESLSMGRQDSGFSEGIRRSTSTRRTSTSSSRRYKSPTKRTAPSTSRPSTKRAPRSSPTTSQARTSTSAYRPSLRSRHSTPSAPYEFFQFPILPPPQPETVAAPSPLPPPATCQYWTSDASRRLEYAAIDAASKGVRGFFIKLVPDCILPPSSRRTRFHSDDANSDAGSVRRYRLTLPEEKSPNQRPGVLRRWTTFGKRGERS